VRLCAVFSELFSSQNKPYHTILDLCIESEYLTVNTKFLVYKSAVRAFTEKFGVYDIRQPLAGRTLLVGRIINVSKKNVYRNTVYVPTFPQAEIVSIS
jgi:hypothetical protein